MFFNHTFHSKVYFLKGKTNKLIFGSSNFTAGGFYKNIEFNSIEVIEGKKINEVDNFFKFCDFNAIEVNDDIIKYYKDNQEEIEKLSQAQKKLKKKIKEYIHQDDGLDPDDYDIDDYYFDFSDYETLFVRNEARDDADIRERRKIVQDKMLALHNELYPQIKKLGVDCHWNPKHISSMIRPCEYNRGRVGWLGIRYGKSKNEEDVVNQWLDANEKDEIKGFQKHGCLQYCIIPDGFEINLFLAVRHDAIDRAHVQEKMYQLKPLIKKEIKKLQGYGMVWEIYNEETDDYYVFQIDNEDANKFCEFLQKNKDGCTSYLKLYYPIDDDTLVDIN